MTSRLPSQSEFEELSDAGDELDSAFDGILGENALESERGNSARALSRNDLPSKNGLAALATASDQLDHAFDMISSEKTGSEEASGERREPAPLIAFRKEKDAEVNARSTSEDFDIDDMSPLGDFAIEEKESGGSAENPVADEFEFEAALDDFSVEAAFQSEISGFGATLQNAWKSCRAYSGSSGLWERSKLCASVLEVAEAHGLATEVAEKYRLRLASISERNTVREALKEYSKPRLKLDKELAQALAELENELQQHEKTIATSWLRNTFIRLELDSVTKAAYFANIVQRADLSPEWWERVTLLAMASATDASENGELRLMGVDDMVVLWDEILPESKLPAKTIGASVQFFQDAIGRLKELGSVDKLFSSGLYLDVVGYQISLREAFFRPEILYACVDFHTELANWLNFDENRILRKGHEADFTKVFQDVRSIFRSQFQDDASAKRLRDRLRGAEAAKARAAKKAAAPQYGKRQGAKQGVSRSNRIQLALVAGSIGCLLFVGIPLLREFMGERTRDLKGMSANSAAKIHPLLISASEGREASLLLGKVNGDKWVLLSVEEREGVANELGQAARMRSLQNVMLYNGDVMVLQIAESELRYLE